MLNARSLDLSEIASEFPILNRLVAGKKIVYLDSAATSLKPRAVIDAIVACYEHSTANINRGVHMLAEEITDRYHGARETVASLIGADQREIVFVRNTTEAINLVANSLPQDTSVAYGLDAHHSNQLPWRRFPRGHQIPIRADGGFDVEFLKTMLQNETIDVVAVTHISNAFGAVNPIHDIVGICHQAGAKVLVDASQSVPHRAVDVKQLDCDFLCFSGHKMCGPSGIGVLYGKSTELKKLKPLLFGGDMVESVTETDFVLREVPQRFEAGTQNIEGVIGLAAACDFLDAIGLDAVQEHEQRLVARALEQLGDIAGLTLHGPKPPNDRSGAVTFSVDGEPAHGVARFLSNRHNIFVRSGYHCAQPAHEALDISPTVRASFYIYNQTHEIDLLSQALTDFIANIRRR